MRNYINISFEKNKILYCVSTYGTYHVHKANKEKSSKGTVYGIFKFRFFHESSSSACILLKVRTNEKVGGTGRWQMFGIILGLWWSMFFPFKILRPSSNKSISYHFWRYATTNILVLLTLFPNVLVVTVTVAPIYWWKHVSSTNRQGIANRHHQ